jgi:hypothetical protein
MLLVRAKLVLRQEITQRQQTNTQYNFEPAEKSIKSFTSGRLRKLGELFGRIADAGRARSYWPEFEPDFARWRRSHQPTKMRPQVASRHSPAGRSPTAR